MKLLHRLLGFPSDDILPKNIKPALQVDESNEIDEHVPPQNAIGNITFSMLPDGNTHIGFKWLADNIDDKQIFYQMYGELLHQINNGDFADEIFSILVNNAESSPHNADMINNIIRSWMAIKEQIEEQPIIQPSNVFNPPDMPDMIPDME